MSTSPVIDRNGITAPQFADILSYLQQQYRAIFGDDVYLANDSQDGQFLAILAQAISDANNATISAYNSFSPATAQGNSLSNMIKLNGIQRQSATKSTVVLKVIGQAGTIIQNGAAQDNNNVLWDLPSTVIIPPEGEILVLATCRQFGAISAAVGAIDTIATPTLGWQTVNNPEPPFRGSPIESDGALRMRQTQAVALPSLSVLAGVVGAVEKIAGVQEVAAYENDSDKADLNGLPPHSIALVVIGGDPQAVAQAIYSKKTAGSYTYGTTIVKLKDPKIGLESTIRYFIPKRRATTVTVNLRPLINFTAEVSEKIKVSVAEYINALKIGQDVLTNRLYLPAQLYGGAGSETYDVLSLTSGFLSIEGIDNDLTIAFNERATCVPTDVIVNVA